MVSLLDGSRMVCLWDFLFSYVGGMPRYFLRYPYMVDELQSSLSINVFLQCQSIESIQAISMLFYSQLINRIASIRN